MYMILWWKAKGKRDTKDYLDALKNPDGSITLFDTLEAADAFASGSKYSDDLRVISIEGESAKKKFRVFNSQTGHPIDAEPFEAKNIEEAQAEVLFGEGMEVKEVDDA